MEDMEAKHGKLFPCNERDVPKFLRKITIRHKKLIKELANDYTTMLNLGFSPDFIDFWHFYKKGNTWERLIIDVDNLKGSHLFANEKTSRRYNMTGNIADLRLNFPKESWKLFESIVRKKLSKELRKEWDECKNYISQ